MPPKLREKYPNLPKYVTESNGRIVYRPRIKPEDRHIIPTDKHGYLKPPAKLGTTNATESEILAAYLTAKALLDRQRGNQRRDLRWVVNEYLQSKAFKDLSPGTQKRTDSLKRVIDHPITVDRIQKTLGDLTLTDISKPLARRIAEKRLNDYQAKGRKGVVMVNREITFLSTAVGWALQHIDGIAINNPFRISKFKEQGDQRYVTDEEYNTQHALSSQAAEYLPIVFEITYLVASRGVETLDIKLSHINPDRETGGIHINRRKGSKNNFIEWSDRLYAAYQAARAMHAKYKIASIDAPLILGSHGNQLTQSGLQSAMQRLKKIMQEKELQHIYWNLHKLKHKGITDAADNRIAGHKSEAMRDRYDHRIEHHKPVR